MERCEFTLEFFRLRKCQRLENTTIQDLEAGCFNVQQVRKDFNLRCDNDTSLFRKMQTLFT